MEPNDSLATATPLTDMFGRGAIDPASDVDWWSFQASGNQTYFVAAMTVRGIQCGTGPEHDTELTIYDETGAMLAHADAWGLQVCPLIVFTPPATGTYYAKVAAQSGVGAVVPEYFFLAEAAP